MIRNTSLSSSSPSLLWEDVFYLPRIVGGCPKGTTYNIEKGQVRSLLM